MNEEKLPENDPFNEEGFDFGEADNTMDESASTASPPPKNPRGSNKKMLGIILSIVIITIGGVGYRFYSASAASKKSTSPLIAQQKTLIKKQLPKQTVAVSTTPSKSIEPTPVKTTEDFSDIEITEAFSSADSSPNAKQKASTQPVSLSESEYLLSSTSPLRLTNVDPIPSEFPPPEKDNSLQKLTQTDLEHQEALAKLNQNVLKVSEQMDYLFTKIKNLDVYSHEVSESLGHLNNAVTTIDNQLVTLTNTTSSLSTDVETVRNEVTHVQKVLKDDGLYENPVQAGNTRGEMEEGRILMEQPEYKVHAVIPGRAWLKSVKGQMLTVSEGDTIGNYGKVLVIDAANGIVLTSSGIAFR